MRRIYSFFLYLFVPFILIRLYWKGRRFPAYRQRIAERFSLGENLPNQVDIWVHTVSLGEVVAATPLVEALLASHHRILITTMTPSGSQQVTTKFGSRVLHQYVPYDLPWCLRRFFKRIGARVGIIFETELWPNLIYHAKLANLELALVNARISDKAFTHYQKTAKLFKPFLGLFTFIGAQSALDAERYLALGAPIDIVRVLGNMKFDMPYPQLSSDKFHSFKEAWGIARPVFIAASTHDDEESQLLSRLSELRQAIPGLILLIAPRRSERFQTVFTSTQRLGFKAALRSQPKSITEDTEVVVLDSMGELLGFFQLSDYAFVGGSLVPIGGHNVLEPIVMGIPAFCGPFMQNSKTICTELKAAKALQWAQNADDLIQRVIHMHQHPIHRAEQIASATAVLKANQGTVQVYLDEISHLFVASKV